MRARRWRYLVAIAVVGAPVPLPAIALRRLVMPLGGWGYKRLGGSHNPEAIVP